MKEIEYLKGIVGEGDLDHLKPWKHWCRKHRRYEKND